MKYPMIIVALLCLFFVSCVSVDFVKTSKEQYQKTTEVEIFWEEPSSQYEIIGRFRVVGEFASESEMFEKLSERAKQEGVEGLIIQNTAEDDSIVWGGSGFYTIDTTVVHALAIRIIGEPKKKE